VTAPRRPAAPPLITIAAVILAVLFASCRSGATPAPTATLSPAPSLTPVPGSPSGPAASPVTGASAGPPTTTDVVGFGRIFDSLPATFPKLKGQVPANDSGPSSGRFAAITGDASAAGRTMRDDLTAQGWSVDVGSALEDGTIVLDATHDPPGCKAEIRFTPVSGSLMMSVLYGASCPFA